MSLQKPQAKLHRKMPGLLVWLRFLILKIDMQQAAEVYWIAQETIVDIL